MNTIEEAFEEVKEKIGELDLSLEELAGIIDHTELSPYKTSSSLEKLCEEAKSYNFHSVCVNPHFTKLCSEKLEGTNIEVDTVVGFPLGQTTPEIKSSETEKAVEDGASEIDMVMNISAFREGNYDLVIDDIKSVLETAQENTVKVIIESGFLTYEEVRKASKLVKKAGADFVKNATGFGPCGANISHIYLMRKTVGDEMGVKSAGGIHDFKDAYLMIAAGASRIGASAGVEIIESYEKIDLGDWIENVDPCSLCPSKMLSPEDVPASTHEYYESKCQGCKYRG